MRKLIGLAENGEHNQEPTSPNFQNLAKVIAIFLEGPVSESLSFHAGWARLITFENNIASIKLGGGCEGCPSSKITLFDGVKNQLQSRFGDEVVVDVTLV